MKNTVFIFSFFVSFFSFSQTEKILELNHLAYLNYAKTIDVKDYYFSNDKLLIIENSVWPYNLRIIDLNLKKEIYNKHCDMYAQYALNDIGFFYIENSGGLKYRLVKANGEEVTFVHSLSLSPFNFFSNSKFISANSSYFFYYTYENNQNCIYKTNGNINNDIKVFQSNEEVVFMNNLNNDILLITYNNNTTEVNFYKFNSNSNSFIFYHSFNLSNMPTQVSLASKKNNNIFINFKTSQTQFIYQTDLTNTGSQTFINNKNCPLKFINNNRFLLEYGDSTLLGHYANPNSLIKLSIKKSDSTNSTNIPQKIGNEHFILTEFNKGFEMAYVNSQDSIEFISDLALGYGSSFVFKENITNFYHLYLPNIMLNDTTVLSIQTNGNDNYYYVYKTVNNQQTSLFKIFNPTDVKTFFIDKNTNTLYWLKIDDYTTRNASLYKRKLSDLDPPQPSVKDLSSLTWFRQMAATENNNFNTINSVTVLEESKEIIMDDEGNIYLYFTFFSGFPYLINNFFVYTPDNNTKHYLKARHLFVKYDKYGNLKWMNSIGESEHLSYDFYKFKLDSNNDLITVGYYTGVGYFDNDSLVSQSQGYFISKIDHLTGNVIWKKKIAENYYDFKIDNFVLDENNNVYFSYINDDDMFLADIQGVETLNQIGVGKLNSSGDLEWLQEIKDKTTNKNTVSFNYNDDNTLTIVKNNNKGLFFQTMDLNGNVIDTSLINIKGYSSLLTFKNDSTNQLFGLGLYKDSISFGRYKAKSIVEENFSFIYSYDLLEPISFKTSIYSAPFVPLETKVYNNEVYVYCSINLKLYLLKFDLKGNFLAYKNINQQINNTYLFNDNVFDINNDYIVLSGTNYQIDATYGVAPLINSNNYVSILKIKNDNWVEDEEWFKQISTDLKPKENDVLIYPNPFINEFQIIFSSYNVDYTSYKVFSLNGQLITSGNFNDLQFQKIDFQNLQAGTYYIQLIGENKTLVKKVVKLTK